MNQKKYSHESVMDIPRRGWMNILLALAILLSFLAVTNVPARAEAGQDESLSSSESCIAYHTVKRGETLYRIGLLYNMVWTKIADANHISNPNRIYAGQVLCIPGKPVTVEKQYIQVKKYDVNIRTGPGIKYTVIGILRAYQTRLVTGKSVDGNWWRILCLNGKVGECYVTALPKYTELITVSTEPVEEVIPTFSIKSVVEDTSVTITTANFPKNRDFVVRMGLYGTQGVDGVYIKTVNSGQGGKLTFTFSIPESLRDRSRIAIRMESHSGYYAYNWFWNETAD